MRKITFLAIATVLMSVQVWAQTHIYFHTTQALGNTIKLGIVANVADQDSVWIDLNGNQSKDDGEKITNFNFWSNTGYTINSQNIRIYGNVKKIKCRNNQIDSLNSSQNVNLTYLDCNSNQLQNLDVSQNVDLTKLYCYENQLQSLDLSKNVDLTNLGCYSNQLQSLDLSQNEALTTLYCNDNQIPNLDVSKNTALRYLDCENNALTVLNIANGNNVNFKHPWGESYPAVDATGNPALTCIQVDNGFDVSTTSWAKDKTAEWNNDAANPCGSAAVTGISIIPAEVTLATGGIQQLSVMVEPFNANTATTWSSSDNNIATVDANGLVTAEAKGTATITATTADGLQKADCAITVVNPNDIQIYFHTTQTVGNTIKLGIVADAADQDGVWIDLNGNQNKDSGEEITNFDWSNTNYIINSQNIRIYGNVKKFNCGNNQIDNLNLSQNMALTNLDCNYNQLQSLDVSQNVALTGLECDYNQLQSLDVSQNVALDYLDCSDNQLQSLDVSQNVDLTYLDCNSNQLQSLDVSQNVDLTELYCYENQLQSLDLSKNKALTYLNCHANQLQSLNLSQNEALTSLYCSYNQLQSLDVSKNTALRYLDCKNNALTVLNIANGNNVNFKHPWGESYPAVDATGNPALTCIQVDNGFDVSTTSWAKDKTAEWNNDAANPCGSAAVTGISIIPAEVTLATGGIQQLSVMVEPFNANTAITWSSSDNNIATVDANGLVTAVAKGTATITATTADGLQKADCAITVVNPNDIQIYFHTTQTVGNTIKLGIVADAADQDGVWIDLNGNQNKDSGEEITNFDFLSTTNYIINSQNIRIYGNVKKFNCGNNQIDSLNLSQNVALTNLDCNYNQLQSLDVSRNMALSYLNCYSNQLQRLGISQNVNLTELYSSYNQLQSLNISQNVNLTKLECYENQLQSLDLSKNKALTDLDCSYNQLQSLDVSKNVALDYLDCSYNQLQSLDPSQNVNLTELYSSHNQLQSLDVSKNVALTHFSCSYNQLQSLDVSQNLDLTMLSCNNNQLQSLDLSQNVALTSLYCSYNQLQSLDVSQNLDLTMLSCNNNQLQSLDLSQNVALTSLYCYYNQLQRLDLRQNTALTSLDCKNNALTALNIANGNNEDLKIIRATDNPFLTCIQVDHSFNFSAPDWEKDDTAEWNNNAATPCGSAAVTSLSVTPHYVNMGIGGTQQLRTRVVPFNAKTAITWSSSDNNIATVDTSGLVTAVAGGKATITATSESGVKARCYLTVISEQIYFHTNKTVGYISLGIVADAADQAAVWIDLNGDQIQQSGEEVTYFNLSSTIDYTIASQEIRVYGNVKKFNCSGNQIDSLKPSQNVALTRLDCYSNQLTGLDISKNVALTCLNCYSNQLQSLDVSQNVALKSLDCNYNQLQSLDVSQNMALKWLDCKNNILTALNIANGNNEDLKIMRATDNPPLICIQIDGGFDANTYYWEKDPTAQWNNNTTTPCGSQTITNLSIIPNQTNIIVGRTKRLTIKVKPINANTDVSWSSSDTAIATVTNGLVTAVALGSATITATSADSLQTATSAITVVNPNDIQIYFHTAQNVGSTINLGIEADVADQAAVWIDLNGNQRKDSGEEITHFDLYSETPYTIASQEIRIYGNVKEFSCENNQIDSLNPSKNLNLTTLYCHFNQLQGLDLSKNVNLTKLYCYDNELQSLDISQSVNLTMLECNDNQLQNLDVSQNVALTILDCNSNQLESLDLSQNVNLTYLKCKNNALTALNIANGNNVNFTYPWSGSNPAVDATDNPFLTCIQVDYGFNSFTNWIKDKTAHWNNDVTNPCGSAAVTSLSITPDVAKMRIGETQQLNVIVKPFNANLTVTWSISDTAIATVTNGLVTAVALGSATITATSADGLKTANCALTVTEPDSIQIYFHTTKTLGEKINLAIEADSADQADIWIDLNGDQTKQFGEEVTKFDIWSPAAYAIASHDIKIYGNVKRLGCYIIQIDSLNTSQNVNLTELWCHSNKLQSLDLSQNLNLAKLKCYDNQIQSLNLGQNLNLTELECSDNELQNLDLSQNVKLTTLNCSENQIQSLNISQNVNLTELDCSKNHLKSLDLSQNVNLTWLLCFSNQLQNLNLNKNVALTLLWCSFNQLIGLDVSKNVALTSLSCYNNQLIDLNLSQNLALTYLKCKNNALTVLNIANGNNANFTTINATDNPALTCIQIDNGFDASSTDWEKDEIAEWNNDATNPCGSAAVTSISIIPSEVTMGMGVTQQLSVIVEPFDANTAVTWSSSNTTIATVNANGLVTALAEGSATITSISADGLQTANCAITVVDPNDIQIYLHTNEIVGNTINLGIIADAADQAAVWIDLNGDQIKQLGEEVTEFNWGTDYTINSQEIKIYGNIKGFNCGSSQIDSLNTSQNKALIFLFCSENQLQRLDLRQNTALTSLNCSYNQLQSLDLRQNTALTSLDCSYNQLQSLDLRQNTALTYLDCKNNALTALNIANGNNANFTDSWSDDDPDVDATENPSLTCIQVDNGFDVSTTNWKKDDIAEWNNDADNPCDWLNGVEELERKQDVSIYPNPANQSINVEVPEQMIGTTINIYDQVGRILMCRKVKTKLNILDIRALPKSIYLVKVGTSISKLIKN